ncbi:MAG: hypothetical protein LCH79_07945 [Proteobacteria bacterium]|nr:hypothetical protein [Pseudomonadota bacterium]
MENITPALVEHQAHEVGLVAAQAWAEANAPLSSAEVVGAGAKAAYMTARLATSSALEESLAAQGGSK